MAKENSIQSMTGYAFIEAQIKHKKYRLNIKSVNNRFFEMKWRAPRSWISLELAFRSLAKNKFQRGSFDFWSEEIKDQDAKIEDSAQNYFTKLDEALKSIKGISKLQMPSFVQALILARQPDLWFKGGDTSGDVDVDSIKPYFDNLIMEMERSRSEEGEKIAAHLLEVSSRIRGHYEKLKKELPRLKEEHQKDARAKLEELFENFNVTEGEQSKISSEVAMLTDKRDCSEEIQRIEMHLEKFDESLSKKDSNLGKRLDFIAQELNREWTTLGSKVRNQDVFQEVLEAKLEIEKIREQCLNLA